ncbi:uncharacterized protein EI90DRAFT_3045520 [Cantharellus anzutake]|uniref:uncharacterized protein n=1 Tax=Cantharellus anzutake TaxID=1750568 RepID=UPI001908E51C|nr:uncharacterized protein EI90DRAFT_3045520 [Cantharellus anzutake]KAF8336367.1 hypothetical protein EI90DRAFT_3045520 [Cantharellus anzutake]
MKACLSVLVLSICYDWFFPLESSGTQPNRPGFTGRRWLHIFFTLLEPRKKWWTTCSSSPAPWTLGFGGSQLPPSNFDIL